MEYEACPRCGKAVSSFYVKKVNGRRYVYAYHGKGSACYLGPEGEYVHAEAIWELGLSNLSATDLMAIMQEVFNKVVAKIEGMEGLERRRAISMLRRVLAAMLESLPAR